MKKITSLIAAFIMMAAMTAMPMQISAEPGVFSGAGTESDPYLISTKADLEKMNELINSFEEDAADYAAASYKLTANISYGGDEWLPLGGVIPNENESSKTPAFTGNFDGDGHTISDLKISSGGTELTDLIPQYMGFFGNVTGNNDQSKVEIKNLKIKNIKINYANHKMIADGGSTSKRVVSAGAFAGKVDFTSIENCHVENAVVINTTDTRETEGFGGFIGCTRWACVINNCSVKDTKLAAGNAVAIGGFIGQNQSTNLKLKNCYAINVTHDQGEDYGNKSYLNTVYGFGYQQRDLNGAKQDIVNCYSTLGDLQGTYYNESPVYDETKALGVSGVRLANIPESLTGEPPVSSTDFTITAVKSAVDTQNTDDPTRPVQHNTVTVQIDRKDGITTAPNVYVAAYDLDGILMDVEMGNVSEDTTVFKSNVSYDGAEYIKVFVWDDNLRPVANVYAAKVTEFGWMEEIDPETARERKKRLILVGDSLMDNKFKTQGVQYGWEETIQPYINKEKMDCDPNMRHGHGGNDIQMLMEGRYFSFLPKEKWCGWDTIKSRFGVGDYLIVALGTNNQGRLTGSYFNDVDYSNDGKRVDITEANKGTYWARKYDDVQYKEEDVVAWYSEIIDYATAKGTSVIILSPPPAKWSTTKDKSEFSMDYNESNYPMKEAREAIIRVVEKYESNDKVNFIDVSTLYSDALNKYMEVNKKTMNVVSATENQDGTWTPGLLYTDHFHLTKDGSDLLAETIAKELKNIEGMEDYINYPLAS